MTLLGTGGNTQILSGDILETRLHEMRALASLYEVGALGLLWAPGEGRRICKIMRDHARARLSNGGVTIRTLRPRHQPGTIRV